MKKKVKVWIGVFCSFILAISCISTIPIYAEESNTEIGEAATFDNNVVEENEETNITTPVTGYDENGQSDENGIATYSDNTTRSGDWSYSVDDKGNYILNGYYGNDTSITLPETLDGHIISKVTFLNNRFPNTVTSVTFAKSIDEIYNFAFEGTHITKIEFPQDSKLTTIGDYAFNNTPLTEFVMPSSLRKIGNRAFSNTLLKKVAFNENIEPFVYTINLLSGENQYTKTTHPNVFAGSQRGLEFVLPTNCVNFKLVDGALLSKDGTILYAQLSDLKNSTYTIPNGVQIIGDCAMSLNDTFSNIVIPNSVTTMEDYCLSDTAIQQLDMPDSVVHVQQGICYSCQSLVSVKLSENLEELGEMAGWNDFTYCSNLTNVQFGSKLRVIGNGCFGATKISSIQLPSSLEQINYAAFAKNPNLKSVTGGENLKEINNVAFGDTGLTDFSFGNKLTFVSSNAFQGCNFTLNYPSYLEKEADGYHLFDGKLAIKTSTRYDYAYEVLKQVNEERSKAGLSNLEMDEDLLNAAMKRVVEISILFDHTRPTGKSCSTASSKMFGENIAAGQTSPDRVMNSWMNSSGHKANILDKNFKSVGIGCAYINGIYYWVQCFGNSDANTVNQPKNETDILKQVSYDTNTLTSNDVRFMIKPASAKGNMMADQNKCYGSTKEYALFIQSKGSYFVNIIDNSSVEWKVNNGATVTENSINVTVKPKNNGDCTLTAIAGKGPSPVSSSTIVNFTDHNWSNWSTTKQPTTSSEGKEERKCKDCGAKEERSIPKKVDNGQQMYRLYNPNSGEHFYTADANEKNHLAKLGWSYEGIGWIAPTKSEYPVYRLYNRYGGEHHYTMNKAEKDHLVKLGWNYEGIGWYSADPNDKNSIPLLREYNPNAFANNHNYTTDKNEHKWLVSLGWKDEGKAWYALK